MEKPTILVKLMEKYPELKEYIDYIEEEISKLKQENPILKQQFAQFKEVVKQIKKSGSKRTNIQEVKSLAENLVLRVFHQPFPSELLKAKSK